MKDRIEVLTLKIIKLRNQIKKKGNKKDKIMLKDMLRKRQNLYFKRYRKSEKGILAEKRYESITGKERKKTYNERKKLERNESK